MFLMNPCLLVLLVPLVAGSGIPWPWGSNSDDNDPATCPVPDLETTDASIPTPFTPLSKDELEALLGWLYSPDRDLNLTDPWTRNLTVSDNYIWQIEDLKPNKTDVLAYFKDATPVPRYARVVLVEGAKAEPVVTEYFAGPLPISGDTTIEPLYYLYNGVNGPRVGIDARPSDSVVRQAREACITKYMVEMADITNNLLGMAFYGKDDDRSTMTYMLNSPNSRDGTQSIAWSSWRRSGLAISLQPTDLYIAWDFSGTDPSHYRMTMLVYNNVIYHSVDEFREAYEWDKVEKLPLLPTDESWIRKDRKGKPRDMEYRMAPTISETEGKRYRVDDENRYVEYLGWTFYTRFDQDIGIQFYNIKFKDEQILYELSLQDALSQYSGDNPYQASTAYSDRFSGFGERAGRLIPGYDCPYHATYWNTTFYMGTKLVTGESTICIFETDIGVPITRHTDPAFLQSTKGSKLVVRQITTAGNYDYLFDYGFYVDGTITVDVHASGYIHATYYRPEDKGRFGPRVQEAISGTLHTHIMNFKADFDLVDTANTFLKTDIVVKNVTQPWFPEFDEFEVPQYQFSELQTEDEGILPIPANGQAMYTVVNKDHCNKWGEPRGYRIMPGLSNVYLPSSQSPFFLKSAQFAKQALAVTRQHDTEPDATATLNQNVPYAPLVEFWKFFDGESLVQEDLVTWVNLGMHHYTRAEDIPNTLMSEAHASIMFAPHNWGDMELTVDLQNAVLYEEGNEDDGVAVPDTNGVDPPACFPLGSQDELRGVFEDVVMSEI